MTGYTKDDLIRVRSHLIGVASRRETITYTDLTTAVGIPWSHRNPNDRKLIGELLGEISKQEYERGRPMLTAIVVQKGVDYPGPGFYGFLDFPPNDEFCRTELRRVHDYWEWR